MQLCKWCGGEIVLDMNERTVCSICGAKWKDRDVAKFGSIKDRQPIKLGDLVEIKMRQLELMREAQRKREAVSTS